MHKRCLILLAVLAIGCNRGASDTDVLAVVNEIPVTRQELETELRNLPREQKSHFESDRADFLEELISRELLYQEAVRRTVGAGQEFKELTTRDPEREKAMLMQGLLEEELGAIEMSEEELLDLYEGREGELRKDFESSRPELEKVLLQQKQKERFDALLQELSRKANITKNEKWIQTQIADNPLDRVIGKGKPVLADFGRGICIQCKKMKPILIELQKEYGDQAHILIIGTDEYRTLTRKHRIRLIPTQVFFDGDGTEYYRHEGFMSKEDIISSLKEKGLK